MSEIELTAIERKAVLNMRAAVDITGGGESLPFEIVALGNEIMRLREALDFIASGTACGPVEVARVALGLKAAPDVG